jgi:hypothetical protein
MVCFEMAALSRGERIGCGRAARGAAAPCCARVPCGLIEKSVRKSASAVALRQGFRVLYVIEIIRVRAAENAAQTGSTNSSTNSSTNASAKHVRRSAQHDTTWDVDSNRYALETVAEHVEPHCLIFQAWRLFRFQHGRMSGLDQRLVANGRASDRG